MSNNLDHEIQKAIIFLVSNFIKSGNNPKPVITHSIRVGLHLYQLNLKTEVVVAGILHDIIEDTEITSQDLVVEFGEEVSRLVQAVTYDKNIEDKEEQYMDCIVRTLSEGTNALKILLADCYDNLSFYNRVLKSHNPFTNTTYLVKKNKIIIDTGRKNLNDDKLLLEVEEQFQLLIQLLKNY